MTLRLTPDMVEWMYEYLRASRPFIGWGLPEADGMGFKISQHPDRFAYFKGTNNPGSFPIISISEVTVETSGGLCEVMAHEMIHLYQDRRGTDSKRVQHNAEFKRLAQTVCKEHGFNPLTF